MSKDLLDKLCASHQLTPAGCNWLKAYLDPFHDEIIDVKGMPDDIAGKSVTVCVRKRLGVVAPPSASANWDCHIALAPVLYADDSVNPGANVWRPCSSFEGLASGGVAGQVVPYPGSRTRAFQNVTIWSDISGNATFCESATNSPTVQNFNIADFLINQETNTNTSFRLVAGGFEVENTSPMLTENGDVTVYRMAQAPEDRFAVVATSSAATTIGYAGVVEARSLPPQTVDKAVSITGSRTWSATEGCYVPFRLTDVDCNPISRTTAKGLILMSPGDIPSTLAVTGPSYVSNTLAAGILVPGGAMSTGDFPALALHAFDTSGAYFTGLSNTSTLSVYLRMYLEIFPIDDEKMVAMAHPSPPADPMALELAQRISAAMPAGVMRKDNDAGDFFRGVLKVAGKVLPVVAPLTGKYAPLVQVAGAAASAVGNTSSKKKKKKDELGRVEPKTKSKK